MEAKRKVKEKTGNNEDVEFVLYGYSIICFSLQKEIPPDFHS